MDAIMKERWRRLSRLLPGCIPPLLLAWMALYFLRARLPYIGHDFAFTLRWLLDGKWHFMHQGLLPFRYAVHNCGGDVMYGNPHEMFYSLPQLITLLAEPWLAIQASIAAAIIAGYWGWYRVGRDVLMLPVHWSHVLATVIVGNGFHIMHVIVGHFTYHTFPLLGILFWLLLRKRQDTNKSLVLSSAGFAFVCAIMLYSGGWTGLFFGMAGFALVLPLVLILTPGCRAFAGTMLPRWICFAAAATAVCISKVVAVYSVMQWFPRYLPLEGFSGGATTSYILRVLWQLPHHAGIYEGTPFMIHEKFMFTSLIVPIGLALGIVLWLRGREPMHPMRVALAGAYMVLFAILMREFTSGHGSIVAFVHTLPVFSSQHVPTRYLYLFALPLSAVGVWCWARFSHVSLPMWDRRIASACIATTIAGLFFALYPLLPSLFIPINIDEHRNHMALFDQNLRMPVTQVVESDGDLIGTTGMRCLNPLLEYAGNPQQRVLHVGPASDVSDGWFNLMNPACYQYPRENLCRPGDRILEVDRSNFERFTHGQPVTWKVSELQHVADLISLFAFTTLIVLTVMVALPRRSSVAPK
jgi:hypothetical protein